MGRHARASGSAEDSASDRLTDSEPPTRSRHARNVDAPIKVSAAIFAGSTEAYVGRRSGSAAGALSFAALHERMALESLRRTDPAGAPAAAGALAAARLVPAAAPAVSASAHELQTATAQADTARTASPERPAVSGGRRRVSRASGPSVFRVPTAAAPAPGSRVATARRRATTASRRRPLLLSVPVIAAAIIVASGIGAERPTSAGADTSAIAQSADVTTALGQSDLRVSRKKREAPATTEAATPSDTPAVTEPLAGLAEPATIDPAVPTAVPTPTVPDGAVPAPASATVAAAPAPPTETWVRPVAGGNVTSCFCNRWGSFHDGIDIDPPYGTPIVSVGDGTVVFAGPVSGYGIGIYIQHDDGSVSFYGHMAVYYVKTGEVVTAGEEIALVGNEGYSTGPHLHFSVFTSWNPNGLRQNAIDPIPWLAARGVDLGAYNPNG